MKEALYYKNLKDDIVQCTLCPRYCAIKNDESGDCGVRLNKDKKLYTLVYGRPCAVHIDSIEKKPLHHFLPGSKSFSIATAGCNFHCKFCQNWDISQARPEDVRSFDLSPEEVVNKAIENNCKSVAYTYTEGVVFYEYALDTMKIAKKKNIRNIIVCNGFINEEPLKEWCKYLDAANIDLKGNDKFYREMCGNARIKPVLETLKLLKKSNVWLEVTNLIIPGYNDNKEEINERCEWILNNLGNIPVHFSRFFPNYKLLDIEATPQETLIKAKEIANKIGLSYVYIGNIFINKAENTYCKCGKLLIERVGYKVVKNIVKRGCSCGEKIPGVWS